ncbi:MAG: DUF374 domain-containing protein [Acidobacteriota bacterium]
MRGFWRVLDPGAFALLARVYRPYHRTLRIRGVERNGTLVDPRRYPQGRTIWAICERDMLAVAGLCAGLRLISLAALGRDGDRAAVFMESLGWQVVRGSSLRGGRRAFGELLTLLDSRPDPAAIVVDGPLGPAGVAKAGVVVAASRTGRPLRPYAVAASPRLVFRRTWSQLYLPLPFARTVIALDDPLSVPIGASKRDLKELTVLLTARLALLRERAEDGLAAWGHGCARAALPPAPSSSTPVMPPPEPDV